MEMGRLGNMDRLKAIWRCLSRSFNHEARAAARSPIIHWLSWLFPMLLFVLISSVFSSGTMLDLPVSVVDNDHSPTSRQLIRNLNAGSHAKIEATEGGLPEALHRLSSANDYAMLYIPTKFEQDILAGKQPSVVLYYNALFYGAGLYSTQDFTAMMSEMNAQYRSVILTELNKNAPTLANVSLSYDSLFNASGSYIYYQQFAATIHLLQLFVVTCTIFVLDRRNQQLVRSRPFGLALVGKLAPYTISYSVLLMVQLAILVYVFGASVRGNPAFMLMIGFCYVMAAQSIGILLYTFTKSTLGAFTLIGILVGVAMTYSGMAVPELSMPLVAQIIANIEPLTHALYAMFDVFLRDVPAQSILSVCLLLLLYPLVTLFLVRKRLMKRMYLGSEVSV